MTKNHHSGRSGSLFVKNDTTKRWEKISLGCYMESEKRGMKIYGKWGEELGLPGSYGVGITFRGLIRVGGQRERRASGW